MLRYFDYHEEFEYTDDELRRDAKKGKRYIIAMQPHGVISYVGLCSWIKAPADFRRINTAAARVVLAFPILKHVMGIFGLTSASAGNLRRVLIQKSTTFGPPRSGPRLRTLVVYALLSHRYRCQRPSSRRTRLRPAPAAPPVTGAVAAAATVTATAVEATAVKATAVDGHGGGWPRRPRRSCCFRCW